MKYLFAMVVVLLFGSAYANTTQTTEITKKVVTTYFRSYSAGNEYDYIQYYGTPSLKNLLKQANNKHIQMSGDEIDCYYDAGGYLIANHQDMNGNGRIYDLKVTANGNKVNATYHDKYDNYLVQFTFVYQNGRYLIDDVRSGSSSGLKQKPKLNGWSLRQEAIKVVNDQC